AWISDLSSEQGVTRRCEPHPLRARDPLADAHLVEVGLGPIKIEAGNLEAQSREPVGLRREQLLERPRATLLLFPRHRGPAHNGGTGNCHPGLSSSPPAERSGRMQLPFVRRGADRTAVRPPPAAKQSAWSTARFVLTLVILAWAVRSFVVAPF